MFDKHASTASVDGLLLELEPLERELKDFTLFDKSYSELDEAAKSFSSGPQSSMRPYRSRPCAG